MGWSANPRFTAGIRTFGDLGTDDVKRLKQLEHENGRLKKILAERDLEIEVMKGIAVKKWWACKIDWSRPDMQLGEASPKDALVRC